MLSYDLSAFTGKSGDKAHTVKRLLRKPLHGQGSAGRMLLEIV